MELLPFVLLIAVMWAFMIRPQQKRAQERAQMLGALSVDDDVVTAGGLYGSIVDLTDEHVDLQVSSDGLVLRFRRDAIAQVVTEPVVDGNEDDDAAWPQDTDEDVAGEVPAIETANEAGSERD